jgi:hypothetical protein
MRKLTIEYSIWLVQLFKVLERRSGASVRKNSTSKDAILLSDPIRCLSPLNQCSTDQIIRFKTNDYYVPGIPRPRYLKSFFFISYYPLAKITVQLRQIHDVSFPLIFLDLDNSTKYLFLVIFFALSCFR